MSQEILSEYQQQYLAKRPQLIIEQRRKINEANYNLRTEYANKVYRDFYVTNGNKHMKRMTNTTDISSLYNWLGKLKTNSF